MDDLAKRNPKSCRSHGSIDDWRQTCDCAMLGALRRTLAAHNFEESWFNAGSGGLGDLATASVRDVVTRLEVVRRGTIEESKMGGKQSGKHQACTPWDPFTLEHIFASCKVEDLIPLDEELFKKRAEESGIAAVTN